MGPVGVGDLPDEPRLPDARLTDDCDHLPMAIRRATERVAELLQLPVPADEACEASRRRRGEP